MSNSVTTAIRGSVRDMAIGKTKTTEKADRATVEQVCVVLLALLRFVMLYIFSSSPYIGSKLNYI